MNINYLVGDALFPMRTPALVVHISNDIGRWGSGFVMAISARWSAPEAKYEEEWRTGRLKLGDIQIVEVEDDIEVCNMIAQHGIKSPQNPVPVYYPALRTCLTKAYAHAKSYNQTVNMPRIGCTRGGGKWRFVEEIIREVATVETFVYDLKKN
jgi:O-acetyl-ADP-ribose deacetylase (regulator of RNase III)